MAQDEPIPGELLRFLVQSRSNPEQKYLLDLNEMSGNGVCTCKHFSFRLGPELMQLRLAGDKTSMRRCKHLRMARDYLATIMIQKLANYHGQEQQEREMERTGP